MKVICVFGPQSQWKKETVDECAWVYEAVVMHTSEHKYPTINERLGCVLCNFLTLMWSDNNVVIDVDESSENTRKLLVDMFKPLCSTLIGVTTTAMVAIDSAEGWDEAWICSSRSQKT